MASIKGHLVSKRVQMLENVNVFEDKLEPVTICSNAPTTYNISDTHTSSGLNIIREETKRPTRSAPRPPRVHSATAGIGVSADDTAEPLLQPHTSHSASRTTPQASCTRNPLHLGGFKYKPLDNEMTTTTSTSEDVTPPQLHSPSWNLLRETFNRHMSSLTSRFEELEKALPKERKELKRGFLIFLAFLLVMIVYTRFMASRDTELDKYFHGLNYSPDQLLVYQGEVIKTIPFGVVLNENSCIVITRTIKNKANEKSDVGVVASNEHRTFPGALLLANSRLVDNSPDPLAVDRAPLTYTVNLPGLTSDGSYTIVPSFSEYQAALNKVLNTWFDNYQSDKSPPSNFQSVESFAYSKQLLRVQFGFDFMNSVIESGIDFNAVAKGERIVRIFKFTQVFYTVSVEPTKRASDLFDAGTTVCEVKQKTNETNPPVLVDSVSYGRNIYVKIESKSLEKQLGLNLTLFDTNHGVTNSHAFNDLHVQVYVVGGHADQSELIGVRNMNEVVDIITKFGKFSKNNLGYPISYSTQFIKDNKKAVVRLSTDYVESVPHNNCQKVVITLIQDRWFCKWEVTWTEVSFDENGNRLTRSRGWNKNSVLMKSRFVSEDIEIPIHVEDLKVVAMVHTILDSWITVISRTHIPLIPKREFYIHEDATGEVRPPISK